MTKIFDTQIEELVDRAAKIIAPLWPMQTVIARNPLQGIESLNFEEAIKIGEALMATDSDINESTCQVNREMIKWCQVFLDEGQAAIAMPEREKGFYQSWALLAQFDKKLGCSVRNRWLSSLPVNAEEAIILCLKIMDVPNEQVEDYFRSMLTELPGWAGYIKWRAEWQNKSAASKNPITLTDFLAVRLVITCAIGDTSPKNTRIEKAGKSKAEYKTFFSQLKKKEEKYLQALLKLMLPNIVKPKRSEDPSPQPEVQIIFCIDVRSEPFRSRIEREGKYETFGFAGFFGLPVSIRSYQSDQAQDCCPVLIKPSYEVFEEPINKEKIFHHQKGKSFLNICRWFYQDLKYNFSTPFALVEALGLWCGLWMAIRTLMPISSVRLKQAIKRKITPKIKTVPKIDIPLTHQVIFAESALRLIGLTKNFSRLVVLCGHGSQTENNPYASALDCGACGGNHGGPNAKILAAILNSQEVRSILKEKGILIPKDTQFVGAEHNTTTDEVIFDDDGISHNIHKEILERLKLDFIKAGMVNSQTRCKTFGLNLSAADAKKHVLKRSSNWAETRPEWGLARNAAFIVGPRSLTKNLDLEGRCFLHSYEWKEDQDGKLLETILTAPLVVAEWINTQYFFSTLNNTAYGSGSKITHNVTGKFGIMQGNGSDLMQGLPLQSVNITDDVCYHEALRLQAIIYAPRSRIDSIIKKQSILQTLLFNHWVILVAIDPVDGRPYRLINKGEWREIAIETDTGLLSIRQSVNFTSLQQKANEHPYVNKISAPATINEKEQVAAIPFLDLFRLKTMKVDLRPDRHGKLTGRVVPKGTLSSKMRPCNERKLSQHRHNP